MLSIAQSRLVKNLDAVGGCVTRDSQLEKLFKMYSAKSRELALNNFTLDKNLKIQMNVFEDLHL